MPDNEDIIKRARESLLSNKNRSDEAHDKALTTLTAGALAVSVTFISNVVHLEKATWKIFLVSAWVLLTLSLMINLVSHMVTAERSLKDVQKLDKNPDQYDEIKRLGSKFNKAVIFCNRLCVIFSLVAIALIITFCSLNVLSVH